MLKLSQIFFRRVISILTVMFLIYAVAGYYLLKNIEIDNYSKMLKNIVIVLKYNSLNSPNIDKIIHKIHQDTGIRVTIISRDGRVLYESNHSVGSMDNHIKRPEIVIATRDGWGEAIRHSNTLNIDLLYVAYRAKDYYIRVAYSLKRIQEHLFIIWIEALGIFGIILGIIFWLSMRWSREIEKDSKKIRDSLKDILEKNYNSSIGYVECCKEFADIRQLIQKVSKKLAKRERQKIKYTKKLKSLTKKQSDIISAISHEFKNPISAIMGYSQTLKETPNLSPQLSDRFLDKIDNNAQKISNMIDRLALAIKLENRAFVLKKSCFRLKIVAQSVIDTLLQKYRDREIILECEDIKIFADRDMIEHTLINLVENALKYSEDRVYIKCDGSRVSIIDEGLGIDSKDIDKITQKYYRVERLSWNNSIGVGLYIVKYILELHDTDLEIESSDRGSIFAFSISKMLSSEC